MAKTKISELSDSSTLDGTELIPVVQSGSTVKTTAQDIANLASGLSPTISISVDDIQVLDPDTLPKGQTYLINNTGGTSLPTGVESVLVTVVNGGTGSNFWSNKAQCVLTDFLISYDCEYFVATNKIRVKIESNFRITQSGTNDPTLDEIDNNLTGVTWAAVRSDTGVYAISPSVGLSFIFNEIFIHLTGTQVTVVDMTQPFSLVGGYYDEHNDVIRLGSQVLDFWNGLQTRTDGIFNDTPIYLVCILSN